MDLGPALNFYVAVVVMLAAVVFVLWLISLFTGDGE